MEEKIKVTQAELIRFAAKRRAKRSVGLSVAYLYVVACVLAAAITTSVNILTSEMPIDSIIPLLVMIVVIMLISLVMWLIIVVQTIKVPANKGFFIAGIVHLIVSVIMPLGITTSNYFTREITMPLWEFLVIDGTSTYAIMTAGASVIMSILVIKTMIYTASKQVCDTYMEEAEAVYDRGEYEAVIKRVVDLVYKKKYDEATAVFQEIHDEYTATPFVFKRKDWKGIRSDIIEGVQRAGSESEKANIAVLLNKYYSERDYEQINELRCRYGKPENEAAVVGDNADDGKIGNSGESRFDGKLIQLIGLNLLSGLVTVITLAIAYPATLCWKEKWLKKHTIIDGRRLTFDGNGMQLFGNWLLWMLLSLVTLGIFSLWIPLKLNDWKAKHTHFADN